MIIMIILRRFLSLFPPPVSCFGEGEEKKERRG